MNFEPKSTPNRAIAMLPECVDLLSTLNGMSFGTRCKEKKKGSLSVVFQQVDGGMPHAKADFMKLKFCFGLQMTSKLQVFRFDCIFPFDGLLAF